MTEQERRLKEKELKRLQNLAVKTGYGAKSNYKYPHPDVKNAYIDSIEALNDTLADTTNG